MSLQTRSIVLWCPDWPVRAALLQHPPLEMRGHEATEAPVALIEKGVVLACSAAARHAGVKRGLRVREAQARLASLIVLPYDPVTDARLFEPVLAGVEQQAPGVQPMRPGMLALRARGPARFYGGEREAAETLLDALAALGVPDALAGIADGPFAAELAARGAGRGSRVQIVPEGGSPAFLAALPVEVMADAAFVALCRRLGLDTLGSLAGFGEDELVARFGQTGVRVHALVTGREASTVVPRTPQRALERSIAFDEPLELAEQVAFAVRQTADDVAGALDDAKLVCTAVTVTIETEREASARTWLHPRWFTAVELVDRVRWQLQGQAGGSTPALSSAVTRVTIAPESVDAAHRHEEGLWGDAPDERVHHALSRVQSMLGHDAVVTVRLGGGRLSSERRVLVPWGDRGSALLSEKAAQPWPGSLPDPQPATVFDPRMPVVVTAGGGEAVTVSERGLLGAEPELFAAGAAAARGAARSRPLTAWAGPWTIEERWWEASAAQPSRPLHRFSIVDADGTAWLLVTDGTGDWQAEARYD